MYSKSKNLEQSIIKHLWTRCCIEPRLDIPRPQFGMAACASFVVLKCPDIVSRTEIAWFVSGLNAG